jgi:archaemetzincin
MAAVPHHANADEKGTRVCIKPLGKHNKAMLATAKRGVESLYGLETLVLEPGPLPKSAYYKPRKRYRASKLLDHLKRTVLPTSGCRFVVGFTAVDISTTKGRHKDWGVLGLALVGGPAGMVSSFRVRGRASRRLQHQRVVKVFNHELGHVLGSYHIPKRGCLMEDAAGTVKTVDRETGLLCQRTRRLIEKRHDIVLPVLAEFPWSSVLQR